MVVVVVFPIGAAIAGGMCVLKTKCAWLFTASEATTRKEDPWAPHVDLRDDAEKRKAVQLLLEQREEERKKSYLSKRGEWNIADLLSLQDVRALDRGSPRVLGRPLQGGGQPAHHFGLHTTGSVFVRPVDASNCDAFFCSGEAAFKCVVLTEHARTPDWLAGFAGEHHTLCDFGEGAVLSPSIHKCMPFPPFRYHTLRDYKEMRCTDSRMLTFFEVGPGESLPVALVVSRFPEAASQWKCVRDGMLRRMNLSGGTYFVLRSRFVGKEASDPALKEFIDSALSVSGLRPSNVERYSAPDGQVTAGKWF